MKQDQKRNFIFLISYYLNTKFHWKLPLKVCIYSEYWEKRNGVPLHFNIFTLGVNLGDDVIENGFPRA